MNPQLTDQEWVAARATDACARQLWYLRRPNRYALSEGDPDDLPPTFMRQARDYVVAVARPDADLRDAARAAAAQETVAALKRTRAKVAGAVLESSGCFATIDLLVSTPEHVDLCLVASSDGEPSREALDRLAFWQQAGAGQTGTRSLWTGLCH